MRVETDPMKGAIHYQDVLVTVENERYKAAKEKARRVVASHANDVDDARELLDAIGLL